MLDSITAVSPVDGTPYSTASRVSGLQNSARPHSEDNANAPGDDASADSQSDAPDTPRTTAVPTADEPIPDSQDTLTDGIAVIFRALTSSATVGEALNAVTSHLEEHPSPPESAAVTGIIDMITSITKSALASAQKTSDPANDADLQKMADYLVQQAGPPKSSSTPPPDARL